MYHLAVNTSLFTCHFSMILSALYVYDVYSPLIMGIISINFILCLINIFMRYCVVVEKLVHSQSHLGLAVCYCGYSYILRHHIIR